jgi:YcxB-like protein
MITMQESTQMTHLRLNSRPNQALMRFQLKYEVNDYIDGYKAYAARSSRRWVARYLLAMAVFLLVIGILGIRGPNASLNSALPAFLLSAFGFYYALTVWNRAARRAFKQRRELSQEFAVEANDAGIALNGPISTMNWTWAAFIKFAEAEKLFLAYLSPCAFVILPKRIFAPGQVDELRELLRQKLPMK